MYKKTKTVFLEIKTAKYEMKNKMEEINGTLNIAGKKKLVNLKIQQCKKHIKANALK